MSAMPSGMWIGISRRPLRVFGLVTLAVAMLLAIASPPAHAEREYECQISGGSPAPPDECNGTGNVFSGYPFYPRAVAVDGSGNIWVADEIGGLMKFDSTGTLLLRNDGSTTWGPGGLTDLAYGITANQMYGQGGDTWKVNPDGSSPGRLATGGGDNAAVDNSGGSHDGDFYAGSTYGGITRYKPDGTPDDFEAGLPSGFEAGQPYLAGNRITGIPGYPQSLSTIDIAVGPDGDVYDLVNSPKGNGPEVFRFDQRGEYVRAYTGAFTTDYSGSKVAVDPTSGNLLVFDGTIWEMDSGGELVAEITGASTKSPFDSLGGIAQWSFDHSGRLYLAGGNIRILSPADPLPRIVYGAETGATRTAIDVHATVDPNGAGDITHCEVQYGKTLAYELGSVPCNPSPAPKFSAPTPVEGHISGLQAETTYHYRVVVENATGERRGDDRTLKLTAVDDVTTGAPAVIQKTSAKVTGSFSDDGTPAKYYFEYGGTPGLGKQFPILPGADAPGGGGIVPLSTELPNLLPGTFYYYRLAVATVYGASHGRIERFKTLQEPTIESFSATEVNETSAELVGKVNPNGFATTYRFEYGPTPAYGQTAPVPDGQLGAVSTVQPVHVQLQGLTSGVTYHFRLTAESAQGTTTTEDQTFTFFPPNCPNAQVRLETGSSYLPDCRAYELVSPGDAGGILLAWDAPPSSSATDPPRFAYAGIFGTMPEVGLPPNRFGDLYVAERSAAGWTTKFVGLPSNVALEQGGPPTHGPGGPQGVLTDPSLSRFMVWNTGTQGYICPCRFGSMAPYILDQTGKVLERLPSNLEQIPGGLEFIGDVLPSGDFSHVFFSAQSPAFVEGARTAAPGSAYDDNRATGNVELISTAPAGGPILQDPGGPNDPGEYIRFPAVSADGSRVLMSTVAANGIHLYMHKGGGTVDVSVGDDGLNHGVEFNGMTEDGSEVIFSSNEQLTGDDHDSSKDIFAWHVQSNTVTRISTGSEGAGNSDECGAKWTSGCDATVVTTPQPVGALGYELNTDNVYGARNGEIYFYSPEQLDGVRGITGERNLYTFHDGQVQHVATLSENSPLIRMQVSPTNDHSAFVTASRLTAYDNHGFAEMYAYDVDQRKLICVSCIPSGAAPTVDVSGSNAGLFMSDDGRTFFTTTDALVNADINGLRDTYEYVDGRPQLISNGLSSHDTGLLGYFKAGLIGVSHDGVDVYIASYETLVSQDHNGQFMRFYDARTGGGFPFRAPPPPCAAADECHGAGSSAPVAPEITSGARLGNGGNAVDEKRQKAKPKKCAKKKKKGKSHCKKGSKRKAAVKRGAGR